MISTSSSSMRVVATTGWMAHPTTAASVRQIAAMAASFNGVPVRCRLMESLGKRRGGTYCPFECCQGRWPAGHDWHRRPSLRFRTANVGGWLRRLCYGLRGRRLRARQLPRWGQKGAMRLFALAVRQPRRVRCGSPSRHWRGLLRGVRAPRMATCRHAARPRRAMALKRPAAPTPAGAPVDGRWQLGSEAGRHHTEHRLVVPSRTRGCR